MAISEHRSRYALVCPRVICPRKVVTFYGYEKTKYCFAYLVQFTLISNIYKCETTKQMVAEIRV